MTWHDVLKILASVGSGMFCVMIGYFLGRNVVIVQDVRPEVRVENKVPPPNTTNNYDMKLYDQRASSTPITVTPAVTHQSFVFKLPVPSEPAPNSPPKVDLPKAPAPAEVVPTPALDPAETEAVRRFGDKLPPIKIDNGR